MERAMRFDALRVSMLAAAAGMGLAFAPANATELQVIQGVPSARQLEDALAPKQPASTVKFRGITLGNQPPKPPSPGTPAAAAGSGAAQPAPAQPTQASAAIALSINFDFNSDKLTPQGLQVLDNLGAALKSERLKNQRFLLEGHTDSKGSDEYNQKLSERRAVAAMEYLIARHGIEPKRLSFAGKGEREPLDPANPDAALNRRVQIMNLGS
jgi:outer membrane protein OmpA-like peptidoglycan-associated protein